jgi:hypothetical protein
MARISSATMMSFPPLEAPNTSLCCLAGWGTFMSRQTEMAARSAAANLFGSIFSITPAILFVNSQIEPDPFSFLEQEPQPRAPSTFPRKSWLNIASVSSVAPAKGLDRAPAVLFGRCLRHRIASHDLSFATGDNVWASRARSQRPSGCLRYIVIR